MKKISLFVVAVSLLCTTGAHADIDVVRIEVGKSHGATNSELEGRVYMLERAVRQLQNRVFQLEADNSNANNAKNATTCFIKTPFSGTFLETAATETAARAGAMKKCDDKVGDGSIWCDEKKVQCGK